MVYEEGGRRISVLLGDADEVLVLSHAVRKGAICFYGVVGFADSFGLHTD